MVTTPPNSEIQVDANGRPTAFIGPDAVELVRVTALRRGILTYQRCRMIPTRGVTISKMIAAATKITGKKYRFTDEEYLRAAADLQVWIDTMKAALPVVQR
jgi:hypothetical protein